MEMPIWAIITLFIAISVGSMIFIWASREIFETDIVIPSNGESRLLRQPTITDYQVAKLIEQCYAESSGKKLGSEVCYSVTLDSPATIDSASISPQVNLDPSKFTIDNGTTSSLSVAWDYVNLKVEVKT